MSRLDARGTLSLDDYRAAMEGVYSTSVSERTIDEAPGAYKPIDDIIGPIAESADIYRRHASDLQLQSVVGVITKPCSYISCDTP